MALHDQIIDELHKTLLYLTYYFQGEPYLNPDFAQMVSNASDKGIYTATSTNAHFLNRENATNTVQSGLRRMIISIDGVDQESYAHYRIGGQLEKVLDGTRELVAAKKRAQSIYPRIIWQFIVFKHNEQQINQIRELSQKYQVDDLQIKSAQIYDYEDVESWLPDNKDLSRYSVNEGEVKIKNQLLNKCWRMWNAAVVTWDGKVVPCCFDKDATHVMGDLNTESFREIWNNIQYRAFRSQLFQSRKQIEICQNCTEGTKVWLGEET